MGRKDLPLPGVKNLTQGANSNGRSTEDQKLHRRSHRGGPEEVPGAVPGQGASRQDPVPAGAQWVSAHRPRQGPDHRLLHGGEVRRHLQPAVR